MQEEARQQLQEAEQFAGILQDSQEASPPQPAMTDITAGARRTALAIADAATRTTTDATGASSAKRVSISARNTG